MLPTNNDLPAGEDCWVPTVFTIGICGPVPLNVEGLLLVAPWAPTNGVVRKSVSSQALTNQT